MPQRDAAQSGGLELLAWALLVGGVLLTFWVGAGLLLALGAVGLLVRVAVAEQRDFHTETRRRLERIERLLDPPSGPGV